MKIEAETISIEIEPDDTMEVELLDAAAKKFAKAIAKLGGDLDTETFESAIKLSFAAGAHYGARTFANAASADVKKEILAMLKILTAGKPDGAAKEGSKAN